MLTPQEQSATQAAIDAAAETVRAISAAASVNRNILGSLLGVFSTGPNLLDDQQSHDILDAARLMEGALQDLTTLRLVAINSPDAEHELAIDIVSRASVIQGSDLASQIEAIGASGSVPVGLASQAKATLSAAGIDPAQIIGQVKWVAIGLGAIAVIFIIYGMRRK